MLFIASVTSHSTRTGSRRQARATEAVRSSGSGNNSAATPSTELPAALPCTNWFEVYPEDVGPMGNVILSDEEEIRMLLLVARPVSAEEAERTGGCLIVSVTASCPTTLQYYCITDSDDEVYGRADYLPRHSLLATDARSVFQCCDDDSCCSCGCTDEGSCDSNCCAPSTSDRDSCRCCFREPQVTGHNGQCAGR
ncbi:hypothetical protein NESM_000212700 [Novymonas esmeraldas]|uniref:Uncharacterized protein n=1 Tax=Novymonas esmeraldas TaxID=1808958 RepID=A0AAW0FAJ1_9TRYP